MKGDSAYQHIIKRNGTKQKRRQSQALNPTFFQVDERRLIDLITIAQKHAHILRYFNQHDEHQGYWTAFLSGDPKEMATFMENPTAFDHLPEKKQQFSRPHLILFFTFLKLLQEAQIHLNDITRRQLDFFYKTALQASPLPGHPDQVHLLAKVSEDETDALIPAGTLLDAGEDGQGNAMMYRTDEDLVANPTQVEQLKSLFVKTEITDFAIARLHEQSSERFLEVLKLVYHQPLASEIMRPYPPENRPFDQSHVTRLDSLKTTIMSFKLRIATFRRIIREYEEWTDEKRWNDINDYFKSVNSSFTKGDPRDFDTNFKKAYGFDIEGKDPGQEGSIFDVLSGIDDIYDFYKDLHYLTQESQDKDLEIEKNRLIHFLKNELRGGEDVDAFLRFMETRLFILSRQETIESQLKHVSVFSTDIETAHPTLSYEKDRTLANAFQKILGLPERNDDYYLQLGQQLKDLENYFFLDPEDYFYIRQLYKETGKVFDWQWEKADELLRIAYSKLKTNEETELLGEKPEIIHWLNMYAVSDATQFKSLPDSPRWKLFGSKPLPHTDDKVIQEASFGWAFCSPHLALSEGERTMTFSFKFKSFDGQYLERVPDDDLPFDIDLTTAKKWLTFSPSQVSQTFGGVPGWSLYELQFSISLGKKIEAIAPLKKPPYPMPFPTMRIIPKAGKRSTFYKLFRGLRLSSINMEIKVEGLKNLEIQTKEGPQKPQKPFTPFGSAPEEGDALLIFHKELLKGYLNTLNIQLEWKNLPKYGLEAHYHHYHELGAGIGIPTIEDSSFKGLVNLVADQERLELLPQTNLFPEVDQALIAEDFAVQESAIEGGSFLGKHRSFEATNIKDKLKDKIEVKSNIAIDEIDLAERERFLELVLTPQDFLHNQYGTLLQLQTQKRSDELNSFQNKSNKYNQNKSNIGTEILLEDLETPPVLDTSTPAFVVLNEPFSPILKTISVDYATQIYINWEIQNNPADGFCYHIEPFGRHQLSPSNTGITFLPNYDAEGSCYIGLSDLRPPQDVSFLFEMAPGTANPEYEPSKVKWSYLSEEEWKPIFQTEQVDRSQARLVSDTTKGLSNSGLIKVYLPKNATVANQRMPSGLHWLRLQVGQRVDSLCDALLIASQGLKATWVDPKTPSDHLDASLPAESITEPLEPVPGLEKLIQPYDSFGGHRPEADHLLYMRFSERMRHKGRALSLWDYERLVLTHFPQVYLAKAYPGDYGPGEFVPGNVKLVVIPDISKNVIFDPAEPKLPVVQLHTIADFLRQKAPIFAQIEVQNPHYTYLMVEVAVRFYDENQFQFYRQKLQKELSAFISPWLFDKYADISLGGTISYHSIVNFIEHRPYVDYLVHPKLILKKRNAIGGLEEIKRQTQEDADDIIITAPDIVVVATPQHHIDHLDLSEEIIIAQQINRI